MANAAAEDEFILPMSFAQQRLWFLDRFEPNSAFYNISRAFRLTGTLDVSVLEASLNAIVLRHEALRTRFEMVDAQPVQIITPSLVLPFEVRDLSGLPESERDEEVTRLLAEESSQPFDLEHGPLLRVKLLRRSEQAHMLLLTIHHIVSDGWSMGVLMRELSALYGALLAGRPSPLEALPIQYADYAVWQREWLQGEELSRQLGYWKEQLEGLAPLELPTDRPRPAKQGFRGAHVRFTLPQILTENLKSLSRREGATLFMTLLAAFQLLLSRYSGQDDIAVGSPIAGRNRPEIEGLIGFFINTLVLRTDLSEEPTFRELLGRVREVCLGAYDHQDLPFEKLVEELQPPRVPSRNPLFDVMFVLQNTPGAALKLEKVTAQLITVERDVAKNDLALELTEAQDGLRGLIEYNTEMFDRETVRRMSSHFETILNGIVLEPEQCIHDFPFLTKAEQQQLLVEWNNTATECPLDECVHEKFEYWAASTPEATAVVFESQRLTYYELNARANQLAHYLQSRGTGPEVLVAICLERSLEMVVGILGVLKAGGAYVPLDPAYPSDRLAFLLEDSGAPILLTQEHLLQQLPSYQGKVLCLDRDRSVLGEELPLNPSSDVEATNLAYVIYTSGTTGWPKGSMITHGALINYVHWNQVEYQLAGSDRFLQKASFCFDASVFDIFVALSTGGQLILVSSEGQSDLDYIAALIVKEKVTTLNVVPSLIQALLGKETFRKSLELKRVLSGGEVLTTELRDRFLSVMHADLYNLYGPTEACVDTVFFQCGHNDSVSTVPIGRPIANVHVRILDRNLSLLPVGVPGELCIGGKGLAQGYLNRPELTEEKFIRDPFSDDPSARLYRSGDMARYLPDGTIEFLGRLDHQVKLRGYRIELGEIEAVLSQHAGVCAAVVLAREDIPGDARLVAYVVLEAGKSPGRNALRDFLKTRMPEYMVPSAFVFLEELPLTPNGKVDRKALPVPGQIRADSENTYVGPKTPVEKLLADIWAEVLSVKMVGIYDNFFDAGGHSLLATQVISRINEELGVSIPLRKLFELPTVAGCSLVVMQYMAEELTNEELTSLFSGGAHV